MILFLYIIFYLLHTSNGDYMDFLGVVLKSAISIVVLFFVTKIIGKKQVSELSLFDYVIGISIGNFAAEIILDNMKNYMLGLVAMTTFGVSAFLVSYLSMKSILFRRYVFGVPTIIIQDGKILIESMKKVNIDINDLLEQARISGYFDIEEISYAIMEANGKISFLEKDKYKKTTKKDLNLPINQDSLTANVVIDSQLMIENIKNTDKSIDWVKKQLKVKGYKDYENILLATYKDNTLVIYPKNKNTQTKDVLE